MYDCVLGLQDLWTRSSTDYTLLQRLELINRQHLPLRLTKSYDFPVSVLYFSIARSALRLESVTLTASVPDRYPLTGYRASVS